MRRDNTQDCSDAVEEYLNRTTILNQGEKLRKDNKRLEAFNLEKDYFNRPTSMDKIIIDKKSADCIMLLLKTYYEQTNKKMTANIHKTCENCANFSTHCDWLDNIRPLAYISDVSIKFNCIEKPQ